MYTKALTHWGRVTHICVGNLTIIGSDNGLSPGRRQAITWSNVGILLIGPLGTNFSEMLIKINIFSFKKIHLKMSSGKWRPFCLGLNVLRGPNRNRVTPSPPRLDGAEEIEVIAKKEYRWKNLRLGLDSFVSSVVKPASGLSNARFTPNHDQLRTDLRVEKFWISWTREQSLKLYRQIAN